MGIILAVVGLIGLFLGLAFPAAAAIPYIGYFTTHVILISIGVFLAMYGAVQLVPAVIVTIILTGLMMIANFKVI